MPEKMGSPTTRFLKQDNTLFFKIFMILFLSCVPDMANLCSDLSLSTKAVETHAASSNIHFSFGKLTLDGYLSFDNNHHAANDFGNMYHFHPLAVLYPKSVSDISSTIKHVFNMGSASELTVAARGHGHSLHGQAQAYQGVVINMMSLQEPVMQVHTDKPPYVDVSGGDLWFEILHETLKHGLTPKSWTDYLHVTVGGTLSNAGISGQAFLHGPQIDNVYQLEVVTGKGDVVTCSEHQNADLFYGVLGGLGQFGIITRARISLQPAPKMVKWIKVLYSDFSTFSKDQEHLISLENSFNYIEGFVQINRTDILNNWRSSFYPRDPLEAEKFNTEGKVLYCLEMAKYFNPEEANITSKKTDSLLSELSFIPSTLFQSDVTYLNFLERVHISEKKLRKEGIWEAPHPWLNLLIPKSKISHFAQEVFGKIVKDSNNGPIIIYPVNKSRWIKNTSFVTPNEDIFYIVGFLTSAVASSTGTDSLDYIITRNQRILDFCTGANLGTKQYLPHYSTQKEWQAHFGPKWEHSVQRKSAYDPLAILAPGQRIFQKEIPIL